MALNTFKCKYLTPVHFKCNYLTPLHFKGLMSHSMHNGSFSRCVFQGNWLHW